MDNLHKKAQNEWRDPAGVGAWWESPVIDSELLQRRASKNWSSLLEQLNVCLIVSREYENFLVALSPADTGACKQTHLPLPHPSGIAYDPESRCLHVACTRNPNQIVTLRPAVATQPHWRSDVCVADQPLLPTKTVFYPGCLYLHDVVWDGERLLGNAVGMNAVVALDGAAEPLWWPKSIETKGQPDFSRNHLQLNSIALRNGMLSGAAFTASTDCIGARKPGQHNFPVNRRGVVFDADSREVAVTGLTRPHSARFYNDKLLINDSGYGRLVIADTEKDALDDVAKLPGWTRGLAIVADVAFVGVSRVLPRFSHYAPGLEPDKCCSGIIAICLKTGRELARYVWPAGNQIFAIEAVPTTVTTGLPLSGRPALARLRNLFSIATTTPPPNPRTL
jgi:uncharacterized protein (TIGR03032 family)